VAHVAFGANDTQTVRAFLEAESYPGPSLIIGYAHCIAHGIEVRDGLRQQANAVASGHWPLFRFDPRLAAEQPFPLTLDSKPPRTAIAVDMARLLLCDTTSRIVGLRASAGNLLSSHAEHSFGRRVNPFQRGRPTLPGYGTQLVRVAAGLSAGVAPSGTSRQPRGRPERSPTARLAVGF